MGGPIKKRHCSSENYEEVQRSRPPGAMEKRILIDIVHVEGGRQESRDDEEACGNCSLQRESAAVVSDFPHGPEQSQGKSDVKAREQPRPERYTRIPHVVGSTDEKASRQQPPPYVDGPKNACCQGAYCLAGNQQGTSPPQPGASENHGDIAQMH